MSHRLESSAVRILGQGAEPVGAGVLISSDRVLTCAHVASLAAGYPIDNENMPTEDLSLDFPHTKDGTVYKASIIEFSFDKSDHSVDLAVLKLESVQQGFEQPTLSICEELDGFDFQAYGYPSGHPSGVWSNGKLGRSISSGLIQVTNTSQFGYTVGPGFSGGAVWIGELDAIAGIVVCSDLDPQTRVSFVIPTSKIISVFEPLRELVGDNAIANDSLQSQLPIGEHKVRIVELGKEKVGWLGGVTPQRIGELWKELSDFEIAYEPLPGRTRDLSDTILRLVMHGIGGTLLVNEPEKWKDRSVALVDNCIGTTWNHMSPSLSGSCCGGWKLASLKQQTIEPSMYSLEFTTAQLVRLLHASMDKVLLDKLSDSLEEMLVQKNMGSLALSIDATLADEMWSFWQEWEELLRGQPKLLSVFFRVMMSESGSKSRQCAQARVGMHTFTPCLLRSIVFALAVRVCPPWNFTPAIDDRWTNVKSLHGLGHICGLQLANAVSIVQQIAYLSWDSDYVMLPHFTDSGAQIPLLTRSISSAASSSRLDKQVLNVPLFITGEGKFLRALSQGKAALKEHLGQIARDWDFLQQKQIDSTTKGILNER